MTKSSYKFLLKAQELARVLSEFASSNNWNAEQNKENEKHIRLEISDLKDKIPVIIYTNGRILPQGKNCPLKDTLKQFLDKAEKNPKNFLGKKIPSLEEHRKRANVFKIANKELQGQIKSSVESLDYTKQDLKPSGASISYRYKLKSGQLQLVVTQYTNGTLFLQGKADELWDTVCSAIEQEAGLSEKEIAGRFISQNAKDAEYILKILTDELFRLAKANAENKIGNECFEFLNEWDKKYFISGFCLLEAELLSLPEYSCVVMPIAKAYEGYLKKLLINIDLATKTETEKRGWNFGIVWGNKKYNEYNQKNKYRRPKLKELETTLETTRHFSMHSNGAVLTQIETLEKAKETIGKICSNMQSSFEFFIKNKGK